MSTDDPAIDDILNPPMFTGGKPQRRIVQFQAIPTTTDRNDPHYDRIYAFDQYGMLWYASQENGWTALKGLPKEP